MEWFHLCYFHPGTKHLYSHSKKKMKKGCERLFVHALDSSMEDHPPGLEKTLWILKDRYLHRSDICPISLGMLPDRRFM